MSVCMYAQERIGVNLFHFFAANRLPQLMKGRSPQQDGGGKGALVFCSCPVLLLQGHKLFREIEMIVMSFIPGSW